MRQMLISELKSIFENMGIKLIKGYNDLKANEIGYEFTKKNKLQLKFQGFDYNLVDEAIRCIELFNSETIHFKCNFEKNNIVWINF